MKKIEEAIGLLTTMAYRGVRELDMEQTKVTKAVVVIRAQNKELEEMRHICSGIQGLADDNQKQREVIELMGGVFENISVQHKSDEWKEEGDTEYAYDVFIQLARDTLTAAKEITQ